MARCDTLSENRCTAGQLATRIGRVFALIIVTIFVAGSSTLAQSNTRSNDIGIGLAGISDWSTQQPFIDVMKTARPWIGHLPGQWGGMEEADLSALGILDENGWPTQIPHSLRGIGTVLLTDLPPDAVSLAGRYRVMFDGDGIVELGGRASKVRYGKGQVEFDFVPGEGPVILTINRTDRRKTGDYVRNIKVVHLDKFDRHLAGEIFNPDWLNQIGGFALFRFMDWMDTNDSTQSAWADRPRPLDYSYSRSGVPLEIMIRLANEAAVDPWFNMPHLADDAYVHAFANLVRETLSPDLTAYVEYSNEVWNWQFEQASWAEDEGRALWGKEWAWMQVYGMRTAQVMAIWKDIYSDQADQLVTVLATQTGWQGIEHDALETPLWRQNTPGAPAVGDVIDAYAVAGYFGHSLGTAERAPVLRDWIAQSITQANGDPAKKFDYAISLAIRDLRDGSLTGHKSDTLRDLAENAFPYHAEVARKYGLKLIMYEGGTHVTGSGEILDDDALAEFFVALNYTPEMGALYTELLDIWQNAGGSMFNAYADVIMPGKWGSWGHLRHLNDTNARWDALINALGNGS